MPKHYPHHRHGNQQTNLLCDHPTSPAYPHTPTCLLKDLPGYGFENRIAPPPALAAFRTQMTDYFRLALQDRRVEVAPPTQCLYMLSHGYYTEQELRGYPGFAQCMRAVAEAETRRRASGRNRRAGGGGKQRSGAVRAKTNQDGRAGGKTRSESEDEDEEEESDGESVVSMEALTSGGYDDEEEDESRARDSRRRAR